MAVQQETRALAEFLHSISSSALPQTAIDKAKMCVEDFLGVAIAGSTKPESQIWKTYCSKLPDGDGASAFAPGFARHSPETAAALNAVFGHVMDLDDVHNASITHLGAVTIPTAIALGQSLKASGMDVITAVVSGYEAGARIGEAINPSSYQYWHTTGAIGAFSSAAAAAKLLSLGEEELVNALGSAGTQAAGLWEFLRNGSMSKVLHTANANLCGIRSARLAALGFTGADTILEGDRGFVKALAPEYKLDCLTKDFGSPYKIEENSFKPYACCRHIHSAQYCMEQLAKDHPLDPEDILSIQDDTYETAVKTVNNPYPENPYAAKFSIQFCIAAAMILGELSDRVFTPENIQDPRIRRLMEKIQIKADPALDEVFRSHPDQWAHRLTVPLTDGRVLTGQVDYPLGDAKNPFDWETADRKFSLLTGELLGRERAGALMERLHRLETLTDINELFQTA